MQTLKKYFEFSKIIAYSMTILVFWISAYATVMSFMFNKSKAENVVKIKNSTFSADEYDYRRE